MNRTSWIFVLALVPACSSPSGGDEIDEKVAPVFARDTNGGRKPLEIADFFRAAGVGTPSLSPDGSRIVFAVRKQDLEAGTSASNLWLVNRDGSELRALTSADKNDTEASFSPDGAKVMFLSNRSGSSQIWTIAIDGGDPVQLTDFGPELGSPQWSPDGRFIAATTDVFPECGIDAEANAKQSKGLEGKLQVHAADDLLYRHWNAWRDGRRSHIVLVDAASGKVVKDLTPGAFESPPFSLGGRGFAFSPDGKELCYVSNHDAKQAESTNADLWTVQVDAEITETSAKLLTGSNKGYDGEPLYSPDGRFIAYITQTTPGYESELKQLAVYDRGEKTSRTLTSRANFDNWVNDMRWRADSRALVFLGERSARTPLIEISVEGGRVQDRVVHGFVNGFELAKDGGIVYTHRSVNEPPEIYASTGAVGAGAKRTRLTHFNAEFESEFDLRPATEMVIRGDGDHFVHTFVVTPHDFDPAKKYPLILNVHGGPQSQWADAWRGDWQVYPAKGYVVAFCNPTGSTGYGQDLTDGITKDYGGRVFRDLMKVTDELAQLPFVDAERMGAMGWSYGGYMMMWFQGHTDRFRCLAAMMGIFDLPGFYYQTEELWFPTHDMGGAPYESDEYQRWSPANFVKDFRTPSLVITGEKDFRCVYTQSLGYYTALRKMDVPADLVVFPNAGHWPAWHEMAFYYAAHLDFFHEWLGGGGAPYDLKAYARNLAFEKKTPEAAGAKP